MRPLVLLVLLLLVTPAGVAQPRSSETVVVTALAVSETSQGFQGVHATVQATVLDQGNGQVFVSTKPLADTDMQGSARLAAQVAASLVGVAMQDYDFLVEFRSQSTVIGGPSAGGVMTLALTTALHNVVQPDDPWELDPAVAATGTINPDGTIGPVGGIPAKAQAAADAGISLFLYPAGLDTAYDLRPGGFGLQRVAVNMQSHCQDLQITCRAAATVDELLEASAHIRLERPAIPTPSTTQYQQQLAPSVGAEVERLRTRIEAMPAPTGTPDQQQRVQAEHDAAVQRLTAAESSLQNGTYYLAATQSFQGHILQGRAENLSAFYEAGRSEDVVVDALERCDAAVTDAQQRIEGRAAGDLNALHALAAAEDRVYGAEDLQRTAREGYDSAFRFEDWIQAMFSAVFCVERAQTVGWWLDVGDAFGPGPTIADSDALLEDAMERARELVAYAQAVTGSAGAGAAHLEQAIDLQERGFVAGALAAAVEAQSLAAVQVQTAAGGDVPDAVMDAARDGASRAIQSARAAGGEPVLPVSLVELSGSQEDSAVALGNLWSARTLALLGDAPARPPAYSQAPMPNVHATGSDDASLLAVLIIGALLGAALVGMFWALKRK